MPLVCLCRAGATRALRAPVDPVFFDQGVEGSGRPDLIHRCPVKGNSVFLSAPRTPPTPVLPRSRQRRPEVAKGGGNLSVAVFTSPLAGEVGAQRRVGGWRGAPKELYRAASPRPAERPDRPCVSKRDAKIVSTSCSPALHRRAFSARRIVANPCPARPLSPWAISLLDSAAPPFGGARFRKVRERAGHRRSHSERQAEGG